MYSFYRRTSLFDQAKKGKGEQRGNEKKKARLTDIQHRNKFEINNTKKKKLIRAS